MKKTSLISLCIILVLNCQSQTTQKFSEMKDTSHITTFAASLQDMYAVFITKDVKKCKAFYSETFGFTVIFESSWFLLLQSPGTKGFSIGFMNEEHPSSPPTPKAMKGDGAFLTLQVADARKLYDAMIKAGNKINYHLKDEDWGQKRFAVIDPNGMHLDIVEQTIPKEGFWDKYMQ